MSGSSPIAGGRLQDVGSEDAADGRTGVEPFRLTAIGDQAHTGSPKWVGTGRGISVSGGDSSTIRGGLKGTRIPEGSVPFQN